MSLFVPKSIGNVVGVRLTGDVADSGCCHYLHGDDARDFVARAERTEQVEDALRELVRRWASHCGLCCVTDASGTKVTEESCVCDPMHQRARKAAGMWPEEKR